MGLTLLSTPAWADFKTERRMALEPGGTFTLDADIGSVTLTGDTIARTPGGGVRISAMRR